MANSGASSPADSSDDFMCPICFDSMGESCRRTIVRLRCSHSFHFDCIGSAFNATGIMCCPICRNIEAGQWRRFCPGHNTPNLELHGLVNQLGDFVPPPPSPFIWENDRVVGIQSQSQNVRPPRFIPVNLELGETSRAVNTELLRQRRDQNPTGHTRHVQSDVTRRPTPHLRLRGRDTTRSRRHARSTSTTRAQLRDQTTVGYQRHVQLGMPGASATIHGHRQTFLPNNQNDLPLLNPMNLETYSVGYWATTVSNAPPPMDLQIELPGQANPEFTVPLRVIHDQRTSTIGNIDPMDASGSLRLARVNFNNLVQQTQPPINPSALDSSAHQRHENLRPSPVLGPINSHLHFTPVILTPRNQQSSPLVRQQFPSENARTNQDVLIVENQILRQNARHDQNDLIVERQFLHENARPDRDVQVIDDSDDDDDDEVIIDTF